MDVSRVLEKIVPSPAEENDVRKFVTNLMRISKTVSGLDSFICGSIGKQTWLKGDHDIDLFMIFPETATRQELEERGIDFGKKIIAEMKGKVTIKYAEHPYVHGRVGKYIIDIVPCYRIQKGEKVRSAVDRSPLHLEYMLSSLPKQSLNDVRLLKQFCKGIGVYGSDARHMGFSGYICELLILKYGKFDSVLRAASSWKLQKMLDFGQANLSPAFSSHPLVIIDPVDPSRNAAANISAENVVKFMQSAGKYISNPDESFFFPKLPSSLSPKEIAKLKSRKTHFMAIVMKKPDMIDDVLYPQIRRLMGRIEGMMRHYEFMAMRALEHIDKNAVIVIEFETFLLPAVEKRKGPDVFAPRNVDDFLSKYSNSADASVYIQGNSWFVERKRLFRTPLELMHSFRRKDFDQLQESGVPENLLQYFKRAKMTEGNGFWQLVKKDKSLSIAVKKKYFG